MTQEPASQGSAKPEPAGSLTLARGETALTATYGGTELFRYVYLPDDPQLESPRPYFHPVRTLAGDVVTLYRPHDHVWHKGIALSLPNVGTDNFWGGVTFRAGKYVQVNNDGTMRHESFDTVVGSGDVIRIGERLSWVPEGAATAIIAERRRVAATAWPDAGAWCLAFETTLINVSGRPIVIGSPTTEGRPNAGYGGLFWRGPRSFTGGTVITPGQSGGDELMGTRWPWLAFTGRHDGNGRSSTLVFRDDPENLRHPAQWFVRSTPFGCVCPAPFFDTEYVFADGAFLTLRYDVVIADGALEAAGCGDLADRAAGQDLLGEGGQ
ncbi:MAG: PmoA family protein [Nocardiopsaceae bacterium]|nr:PmoA family protein [Nocardiopsaceae bacterium]